jgi:LuxR family transcriptional regulator, maltose regulon positive regulatory protein
VLLFSLLVLHAQASDGIGKKREALRVLQQAVAIGERRGAIRIFLEQGAPMARLLRELYEHGVSKKYIASLLAAFSTMPTHASPPSSSKAGAFDALTGRELEVLKLIELRYSDREIAQTLVISPFTVRAHVNNIYAKLDSHDRRQVAAKARVLGILK